MIAASLIVGLLFVSNIKQTQAVYDPLLVPNNKIGIHILFLDELLEAGALINSNGGDWGYVTVPIQAGDKDIKKWQSFMDEAKKHHIIPILRIATEGDYFKTTTWRKPEDEDIIDFANFLNSLNWPVKNRYVIIFNEVNRGDEWGGYANPHEYANLLSYAVSVFKSRSQDFFIISSGMDNGASTDGTNYSEYDYFELMNAGVPGIFNQIDGFSSHSYPNPGFSQPPSTNTPKSINSFSYELATVESLSLKKLPVFITETGWDQELFSDKIVADYFKEAIDGTWNDPRIVAVTPFLLKANAGPFEKFSFLKNNGDKKEVFLSIENLPKTKGEPQLPPAKKVLGTDEFNKNLPIKDFSKNKTSSEGERIKSFMKWLLLAH